MKNRAVGEIMVYVLVLAGILCLVSPCQALAAGLIDSSRSIDWSRAGVTGGIPNRTAICATLNPGATSTDINNALASCSSGGVVFLNPGTYTLAAGINFAGHSNVTLRGAGPDQTIVKFSGPDSCHGLSADICVSSSIPLYDGHSWVMPGGSNAASWSGGYAQGATQITLTNVGSNAPTVGTLLVLDQANDTSDNGGWLQCDAVGTCSMNGGAFGRTIGGVHYSQIQIVKVTAINGNTYTISPGLYATNWRASQTPGAWWSTGSISYDGIEGLTLDHSASALVSGVNFYDCYQCWMKNVRSLRSQRNHVFLIQSAHVEVRDSYFFGVKAAAEESYGVEPSETSDDLIENNMFDQVTSPVIFSEGSGVVVAYNFSWNDVFTPNSTWLIGSMPSHDAGSHMNLFEGNYFSQVSSDTAHGGSPAATVYRNWIPGNQPPPYNKVGGTQAIQLQFGTRAWNVIGNVLGYPGYHTGYETAPVLGPATLGCNNYVYYFGWATAGCNGDSVPGNDDLARSTLFRWGNYDTVTGTVHWSASEVPTTGVPFVNGNPVPADHNLQASLYLSAKPGWWPSNTPWPPIGPDVTGGDASVGGHVYKIPAQVCWENSLKDADGIATFNANTCYPAASAVLYGDVSENGSISSYDASLTAQYSVGLVTLTAGQLTKADVSGNGSTTSYDASLIAQYAVGLITKFPVQG